MTNKADNALSALEKLCDYAFNCYGARSQIRSTPKEIQASIETLRTYITSTAGQGVPDGMVLVKKSSTLEPDFESMGRQILDQAKRIKELERDVKTWKEAHRMDGPA